MGNAMRKLRRDRAGNAATLTVGDKEVLRLAKEQIADLEERLEKAIDREVQARDDLRLALTADIQRAACEAQAYLAGVDDRLRTLIAVETGEAMVYAYDVADDFSKVAHKRIDSTLSWLLVAAWRAVKSQLLRPIAWPLW
jgi:hypothetical protein